MNLDQFIDQAYARLDGVYINDCSCKIDIPKLLGIIAILREALPEAAKDTVIKNQEVIAQALADCDLVANS